MWLFFLLAVVGLIASALAHFSTYVPGVDLQDLWPQFWVLHIGIFAVWIPALAVMGAFRGDPSKKRDATDAFDGAPRWMRTLCKILFAYMFVNFIVFMVRMSDGSPTRRPDGTFALSTHGRVTRTISEDEYHRYRAYEVRGMSGHWMGFYAMAMTMLASGMAKRRDLYSAAVVAPRSAPAAPAETRGFLLPIWANTALSIVAQMVGFFAGPALLMFLVLSAHYRPGCFIMIPFFGSAIVGLGIMSILTQRYFPARCPACGGRTYCFEETRGSRRYRCRDCGHEAG